MRTGLAVVLLGAVSGHGAVPSEWALAEAKEQALQGNIESANDGLNRFLKTANLDDAMAEQWVMEQIRWGSLYEAAYTVEVLLARAELTGSSPRLKALLARVMTLQEKEVDLRLAMTGEEMARLPPGMILKALPQILQRVAKVDPVKSDRAVRHVFGLLQATSGGATVNQTASELLVQLGQVPELMGTVLELAEGTGLTGREEWCDRYIREVTQPSALCRPGHAVAALTSPALGGGVESFRDVPTSRGEKAPTLYAKLVELLRTNQYSELRWEVLGALEGRQPETFGTGITRLLLDDQKDVADLRAYLMQHERNLRKLSDRAAGNLLSILATRFEEAGRSGTVDPALRPYLQPLMEAEAWHLDTTRLAWRNAKHLSELKLEPDAVPAVAQVLLKRLVFHGSPETGAFLADVTRLLGTDAGELDRRRLGRVLREAAAIPELTAEVLKLAKQEGFQQDGKWLAETLKEAWRSKGIEGKAAKQLLVLDAVGLLGDVTVFAGSLGGGPAGRDDFLKYVLGSLEHRSDVRNTLLSELGRRPERTFGVEVLGTLLKPGREKGMITVAVQHRDELASLPADLRSLMAAFFAQWVGNNLAVARAVPGFGPELNITLTERSLQATAEVDRLLSLNSVEELYPAAAEEMERMKQGTENPSESMKSLAQALAEASTLEASTGAEAFGRVSTLIYTKDREQSKQMLDNRMRLFGIWLLAALDHPVLHPLVQKELGKIVLQRVDYFWVERAEKRLVPEEDFKQAETAVARMERCGLLVEAAEFKPLVLARHCSTPETFSRRIQQMPAATRGEAARLLLNQKPSVFGATVMAAMLQPTWQEADRVLKAVREELGRLSAGDVQLVCRAFAKLFPQIEEPGSAPPEDGVLAFMLRVNRETESRQVKARPPGAGSALTTTTTTVRAWAGADAAVRELRQMLRMGDFDAAREALNHWVFGPGEQMTRQPAEALMFSRSHVSGFGSWREERLMGMFRVTPSTDLAGILLGGAAMDRSGQIGLPGTTLALEVSLSLEQGWQNVGGQAVPEKAVRPFLTPFVTGLGPAPLVSAAPAFTRFLKTVPRRSRQVMLQWAAGVPAGDELSAAAMELAFAIALVDGENTAAAWKHYSALVGDAGLNPRVRLDLVAHLCAGYPRDVPPATVLEGFRLATESWARRDWNHDDEMVALFEVFVQLPEGDAWNETAGTFAREWKALLKTVMTEKRHAVDGRLERAVLGILSRLGDQEGIDLLMTYFHGVALDDRWRIPVLARYGQSHRAADMVRRRWQSFTGNYGEWQERPSGQELPAYTRLASLSGQFKDTEHDVALIAEYLLLYDARPRYRTGAGLTPVNQEWARRLGELASKVAKSPVTNREARRALHGLLVTLHPETLLELSDGIVQDLAVTGWRTGGYAAYGQAAWPVKLLGMQAAVRALDGDIASVQRCARQIGRTLQLERASDPSIRIAARGAYYWQVLEGVAAHAERLTVEQRTEFMKLLERDLAIQGVENWGEIRLVKWVVDCWAATGSPPDRAKVRELKYDMGEDDLQMGLRVLGRLAQGAPLAFRERLMLAVASSPVSYDLLGRRWVNSRQMLLSSGLLTPDELVVCGAKVVHAMRDSSKIAQELAMLADDLGQDARVVELSEAGLAGPLPVPGQGDDIPEFMGHLPVDEQVVLWRSLVLRKASGLIRLKQMAAAKQALARLEGSPRDEARVLLEKLADEAP